MCYPTMVGNQKWKIRHTEGLLRTLITEADEALAAVIFENNFEEWDMLARGLEIDKNKRLTRYTHGGGGIGWSKERMEHRGKGAIQ